MSFKVRTEPGGHAFEVTTGEGLLTAALHQGIGLPYGCRNGQCGSCAAQLLQGEVAYPDGVPEALRGRNPDTCITCQAVLRSDLIIRVQEVATPTGVEVRILLCRVVTKRQLGSA